MHAARTSRLQYGQTWFQQCFALTENSKAHNFPFHKIMRKKSFNAQFIKLKSPIQNGKRIKDTSCILEVEGTGTDVLLEGNEYDTPKLEIIEVGEFSCEVLKIPAKKNINDHKHQILVIPGNPGIAEYYSDFCRSLWNTTGGGSCVVCLGLVGHSASVGLNATGATYTMFDQMDHIERYVAKEVAEGTRLTVVGHSIGVYLALDVMRRHPDLVHRVVGIFPYIWNNPQSDKQNFIRKLLNIPIVVFLNASLAGLLGRLGKSLGAFLIRPITKGFDAPAAELTREKLEAEIPELTICLDSDHARAHAFCVNKDSSRDIADLVGKLA